MDLADIFTLRDKLINDKDFKSIFEFFFDRLGDDDEFLKIGRKMGGHPFLEGMLRALGKSQGREARIEMPIFVRIASLHFVHGACILNGQMSNFFYFEDIQHGMICISAGSAGTQFMRISARKMPGYSEN